MMTVDHMLTRDHLARELETREILAYVKPGMRVLEIGCGDGQTLARIAKVPGVDALGVDRLADMIARVPKSLNARVGSLEDVDGRFDLVVTQRALVTMLPSEQRPMVARVLDRLAMEGRYVAVECDAKGLAAVNVLRGRLNLPIITPPVHDAYLDWGDDVPCREYLERVEHFGSTYAFLSRVVNAGLAEQSGHQPDYAAPVNQMALGLPSLIPGLGQYCIWVWHLSEARADLEMSRDFWERAK